MRSSGVREVVAENLLRIVLAFSHATRLSLSVFTPHVHDTTAEKLLNAQLVDRSVIVAIALYTLCLAANSMLSSDVR
jgi:hypothetical protein